MDSLREKLSQAVVKIEEKGKAYADARALSWQMQEMRKVVLAEQTRKSEGSSMIEKETNARTSEVYKQHLLGTSEAIKKELTAQAEYKRWLSQWESLRSLISYEKTQMKVFEE